MHRAEKILAKTNDSSLPSMLEEHGELKKQLGRTVEAEGLLARAGALRKTALRPAPSS